MSPNHCVRLLEHHQAWRRFDGDMRDVPTMLPPKVFGDAIDAAIEIVKQHDDLVLEKEELQHQLDERGGVLELHRIRVVELEEERGALLTAMLEISQVACSLSPEQKIANAAIKSVKGDGAKCKVEPDKQTTTPAIVFFPCGSLGEAVEEGDTDGGSRAGYECPICRQCDCTGCEEGGAA